MRKPVPGGLPLISQAVAHYSAFRPLVLVRFAQLSRYRTGTLFPFEISCSVENQNCDDRKSANFATVPSVARAARYLNAIY
jgi:hypothetical protein